MTCTRPIKIYNPGFDTPMLVPCGSCRACRLKRVKEWTARLIAEVPYHKENIFVTLTYNDDSLPIDNGLPTLVHRDVQLFFKRLRRTISPTKIKFFLCGEYGGETYRPHYHGIIFGYRPIDNKKKPFSKSFTSSTINDCWQLGDCEFGSVTPKSCAYVAGYITKKLGTNEYDGMKKPYVVCSKGIGKQYCLDNASSLTENLSMYDDNGLLMGLPRYYKKVLEIPTEILLANYKKRVVDHYTKSGFKPEHIEILVKQSLAQYAQDLKVLEKRTSSRNNVH